MAEKPKRKRKRKPRTTPPKMRGIKSLFRLKDNEHPVSVTLIPAHHEAVKFAVVRTGLTRSDLFGLMVELYADGMTADTVAEFKQHRGDL